MNAAERELVRQNVRAYCYDPRHETPCPEYYGEPCGGCANECDPKYRKDRCDMKAGLHVMPHKGCILR
jgi:hypothetical protein